MLTVKPSQLCLGLEMTTYEIRPGTFAPCELFAVDERGERYIIAGTHTVCARVKDEIETAMKGR